MNKLDFLLDNGFRKENDYYVSENYNGCDYVLKGIEFLLANNKMNRSKVSETFVFLILISESIYISEYAYPKIHTDLYNYNSFKIDLYHFMNCFKSDIRSVKLNKLGIND